MNLSDAELARFLIAAGLLLLAARATGTLFVRLHQPRVIGEIAGGMLLGPGVLGALLPDVQATLFPTAGAVGSALGAVYNLGLIALMFATGTELRVFLKPSERSTALAIALMGMAVPFLIGIVAFEAIDTGTISGPAHHTTALALVFGAGIAITAIPIISRVLLDLGLLATPFGRTVIGAAVMEDVVLYSVLGIALGLAQSSGGGFGLAAEAGLDPASVGGALYYTIGAPLILGGAFVLARVRFSPATLLDRLRNDLGGQVVFVFGTVVACLLVNVPPLFGGLVSGIVMGGRGELTETTRELTRYGLALLAPIYFAVVGFRVDLVRDLDLAFFAGFFSFAFVVKIIGVFVGARFSGQDAAASRRFAIAMSARGSPGIILASLAFDAGIINAMFYTALVMLAVVSTLFTGWWLERATRAGVSFDATPTRARLPLEVQPAQARS